MEFRELEEYINDIDDAADPLETDVVVGADGTMLVNKIVSSFPELHDPVQCADFEIAEHDVMDERKRKDKVKLVPVGEEDDKGKVKTRREKVLVNRIAIPLQKQVTKTAAAFIVGGKIKLDCDYEEGSVYEKVYKAVSKTWHDNKIKFKLKQLVKRRLSEMEVAMVWYSEETKAGNIEMKHLIISPKLGYKLHPVFDETGTLLAFGYSIQKKDGSTVFVLFTDDYRLEYVQKDQTGDFILTESKELIYGKLPIIYFCQDAVYWFDQKPMMNRLETNHSNHGDTNDYFASPMLKMKGKVKGVAAKGEAGKAFQMDTDADIDYVTWDHSSESLKLENSDLRSNIFTTLQIPDLSPEFLKSIGVDNASALDRIFSNAHLMAQDEQDGDFGECVQRLINFLVSAHIALDESLSEAEDIQITATYSLFRINAGSEIITDVSTAFGGKPFMSLRTAVETAGLVDDVDQEVERIQEETDALGEAVEQ